MSKVVLTAAFVLTIAIVVVVEFSVYIVFVSAFVAL